MAADTDPKPTSAGDPSVPGAQETSTALVENPLFSAIGKSVYDEPDSDTTLYRVPFLNAAFAISSLLLLVVTIWSIWDDYSREWKYYQYEWQAYQRQKYETDIEAERKSIEDERTRLTARKEDLEARMETRGDIDEKLRQVEWLENDALQKEKNKRAFKAELDSAKFFHEEEKEHIVFTRGDTPESRAAAANLDRAFQEKWVEPYEELQAEAEAADIVAKQARAVIHERLGELEETRTELEKLEKSLTLLQAGLDRVEASAKNAVRSAPLLDFFDPRAKIHKAVVADLTEPLNFVDVPRVDRCKSCHVNIDEPDPALADLTMESAAATHKGSVFRSHPRLDLFVGSESPHPYQEFGCTICHYGDGHSLTFVTTAHTPADDHELEEWEKKYDWHEMHHQEFPMTPQPYITATCAKCHVEETRIRGADTWNRGRELVEYYGCFGCHKMKGLEGYRKVGPDLSRIASKTTREFLYKWIREPGSFRKTTRMPQFFDLDNTRGTINTIGFDGTLTTHDFNLRNGVEALALATFLHNSSKKREEELFTLQSGLVSNPYNPEQVRRGREIFRVIGCTGCHSMLSEQVLSEDGELKPDAPHDERFSVNDHAPDLSTVGSKLEPAFLLDWIVDPEKYFPETRMPRLKIEEMEDGQQKLADLVAYLMSKRSSSFEEQEMFQVDSAEKRAILKDLAFDYARRKQTRRQSRALIEGFYESETEGQTEAEALAAGDGAALAYVGQRLVQRYGCFGCHEGIEGYKDAQPIGTDLSKHGVKNVHRLEFAHWGHQPNGEWAIPHNRIAWFTQKLENPRTFDMLPVYREAEGIYEPSEKRMEKSPEELLKMPRFAFHDNPDDVRAVVTFVMSQVPDPIPPRKQRLLDKDEKTVEAGLELVRFLNCAGCHRVGTEIQEIPIEELPRFSYLDPQEKKLGINLIENETWLAEPLTVKKYEDPQGRFTLPEMTFPKHTFLSQKFLYTIWIEEDEEFVNDAYSVVEIADFYWKVTSHPKSQRVLPVYGFGEGKVMRSISLAPDNRVLSPPLLRREGARIRGQWLFEFLLNVHKIRTSTEIRMPQFGFTPEESRTIAEMFRILSDIPGPHEKFQDDVLDQPLARQGEQMFKSLSPAEQNVQPQPVRHNCDSCHPVFGRRPSNADMKKWGPDLGMASKRLRPDWVRAWLADPKSFLPGTPMPTFFFETSLFPDQFTEEQLLPEAERQILNEMIPFLRYEFVAPLDGRQNWKHELDALMQYLVHMNEIEGE